MDKRSAKQILDSPVGTVATNNRDKACEKCGIWPCYATAPECYFYELLRESENNTNTILYEGLEMETKKEIRNNDEFDF